MTPRQDDLFDPPFARDSDTSRDAAESVADVTGRLRRLIYKAIFNRCGGTPPRGMTCDEVEVVFNMRHQTASARVYELRNQGWIEDSERRRHTRSGRSAVVWVITKKRETSDD